MSRFFTPHAQERAMERYGLDLHTADMLVILAACQSGAALCGKSMATGHVFIMQHQGKTIVPVLNATKTFIVTFLPANYFVSGNQRERLQKLGKAKQKPKTSRHPVPKGYRRERITIAEAEEESL